MTIIREDAKNVCEEVNERIFTFLGEK